MSAVLNIAAYRFVELDDIATLRERIQTHASAAGVLGTVLLATEGINLVLAGEAVALRGLVDWLRGDIRLTGLETKESWSERVPFRRLLVKVKREIIRMNQPAIRPAAGRAPSVDAPTLARWIDAGRDDAGRPLVLLDTRNRFEVAEGRFRGATDLDIGSFGAFPAAASAHRAAWAGHTVVSYCTGGIRCEKAAIFLAESGVGPVFQLEGGILRYFEQVGGRHFDGHCVVFDDRGTLDERLTPTLS